MGRIAGLDEKLWGPGSDFKINSKRPVTVTTQFITDDGTDSGKINAVRQFYTQNGKTIEHRQYEINGNKHDRITDDFCKDWVATTKDGTNFIEKGGMGEISPDGIDCFFENVGGPASTDVIKKMNKNGRI